MNSLLLEPKYRDMDTQTEELLSRGSLLENGMVVLIEDPAYRTNLRRLNMGSEESQLAATDEAKVANRWCEVSEVFCRRDVLTFVAIYPDGTKRKRTHASDAAWFVKLDSLPKEEEPEDFSVNATETQNADNTEGSEDRLSYAEGDAEATMNMWGATTELKQPTSFIEFHGRIEDIQAADGPLARALRNR